MKIARTWKRNGNKPVKKAVHFFSAQRYLYADRRSLAKLERRNGFACFRLRRFLSCDEREPAFHRFNGFLVAGNFSDPGIQYDLLDLWRLRVDAIPEFFFHRGYHFFYVFFFKTIHGYIVVLHFLHIRDFTSFEI